MGEGCLGEDIMKTHMIKMKKAAATCMKKDAPELDLALFNNDFRLANVLTRSSNIGGRGKGAGVRKMMKAFMQMQMISQLLDDDSSPRGFAKRAADDEFDLGSKLQEKLAMKKEGTKWAKMLKDEWLSKEMLKYCDQCVELAQAVPKSMLDECPWGGEMVKVKTYMKCIMKHKVKVCM